MNAFITIKQQRVLDFVRKSSFVWTSEVAELEETDGVMSWPIGRGAAYGRLRALEQKRLVTRGDDGSEWAAR
jgi:hypothetical protein